MNPHKSKRILYIILLSFSCLDENRIDSWEITKRVQPIIEAKAKQCNSRPIAPLFFTRDVNKDEVETCEKEMIAARCPFRSYPWSCLRIF
ncbi:MAG: hypothetical protein SFU98_22485 [Leptospiraceae bacterium]|nr:hypothetical protein [Leptospiraceae bacterium]